MKIKGWQKIVIGIIIGVILAFLIFKYLLFTFLHSCNSVIYKENFALSIVVGCLFSCFIGGFISNDGKAGTISSLLIGTISRISLPFTLPLSGAGNIENSTCPNSLPSTQIFIKILEYLIYTSVGFLILLLLCIVLGFIGGNISKIIISKIYKKRKK